MSKRCVSASRRWGLTIPDTAGSLNALATLYQAMAAMRLLYQYMREGHMHQNTILTRVASAFPEAQVYPSPRR